MFFNCLVRWGFCGLVRFATNYLIGKWSLSNWVFNTWFVKIKMYLVDMLTSQWKFGWVSKYTQVFYQIDNWGIYIFSNYPCGIVSKWSNKLLWNQLSKKEFIAILSRTNSSFQSILTHKSKELSKENISKTVKLMSNIDVSRENSFNWNDQICQI